MKKNTKTVLQVILMIFVMNVSASYSACCSVIPASDDVATMALPCHQNDNTETDSQTVDDCYLCVQMISIAREEAVKPSNHILFEFTIPASITYLE